MPVRSVRDSTVQTVGLDEAAESQEGGRGRPILVTFALALALVALLLIGAWVARLPADERVARAFAAAIDEGDVIEARRFIEDPTIVMWPTYWSVLNTEHISPFGDRLDDYVEYHHALGAETTLSNCTDRPTSPDEVSDYDNWVRCDYVQTDALASRIEGTGGATTGQLSFGMRDGKIGTVFVIRSDQLLELARFRNWLTATHPESYAKLLQRPAVLQIDVPIMGLVATDYNMETAAALLRFAEDYVRTGSP